MYYIQYVLLHTATVTATVILASIKLLAFSENLLTDGIFVCVNDWFGHIVNICPPGNSCIISVKSATAVM